MCAECRLTVFLVEDNPADICLFQEAAAECGLPPDFDVVENGRDALRFLRRQECYAAARRPDVIVMDLNLPIKKGGEVLREISADPGLNTIPVAVLTTADSERHVCELYPPGRCLYFVKPYEFNELVDIVRQIRAHAEAGMRPPGPDSHAG